MKYFFTVLFALLMMNQLIRAAGFQINDHSARSVAMGFSTVAFNPDPSAIYFNPACLSSFEGILDLSAGLSYIMPAAKFTGPTTLNQNYTEQLETWNFPIPNFFVNWRTPIDNLNFGMGVFVPFGLGTKWPVNWYGRFLAKKTYLEAIEINPNFVYAFKLGGVPLSFSVGFGYVFGAVELERNLSTFSPEPILNLKGDGTGTTFNFGLNAKILDNLHIGAAYRHNIEINFEGETKFSNVDGLSSLFQEGPGRAKIKFPNDFRFGIAYWPMSNLLVEVGMNYVGWSSYDTLKIEFDKGPGNPQMPYTSVAERLYKDIISYRLGLEYTLEDAKIRLGGYYEPIPVDEKHVEPILPESNRFGFTGGIGYKLLNNLNVDLGYLFILGTQTNVIGNPNNFDGYYNTWANIVSLSFSYSFK